MAFSDESGVVMPVTPMANGGFGGGFGADWGWIILLLLFAGGFNGFGGGFGGGEIYPWMNQADITTSGFQNLATQNQLTAVQSDLGDIQTQLCGGFAGVNATINNGFSNLEVANNARQIADMQTSFGMQTAMNSGFNGIQAQLAQCCCDNRLATNDLKYTIATEACADRAAGTQNTQMILDKLCQIEIDNLKSKVDSKNEKIADLQNQLNIATFNASQTAQNGYLQNALTAQTQYFLSLYPPTVDAPAAAVRA